MLLEELTSLSTASLQSPESLFFRSRLKIGADMLFSGFGVLFGTSSSSHGLGGLRYRVERVPEL